MIIYPPGRAFQRGEDRCQVDIESSFVNCCRACNDLGYVASCLKSPDYNVFLRDYQAERLSLQDFLNDIKMYAPDIIFISTTNGSIYYDLDVISEVKKIKNNIAVILKGALFFNPHKEFLDKINLSDIDYLIGGEIEFIIKGLIDAHFKDKSLLKNIQGISYKQKNEWIIQNVTEFNQDLDSLPFPDRSLMKNELYVNPATNKPMALITTAKGCCFNCFYCLSPIISGKKVRFRSSKSIFDEIKECTEKYNIFEFFLKSDTFTANRERVIELCKLLINSGLNKTISWTATARVDTIDDELVKIMKDSGCKLLAFGFESGSNESLKKMKKGTTIEQNCRAAKLCKKYDIKILGHFLIGFPWENETHIEETKKHIFELDADYIEISVVVPYYKTPVYEELFFDKEIDISDILGHDSYKNITNSISKLSSKQLLKFKKDIALKFYLRPSYIIKKFKQIKSPLVLKNYIYYGFRMIKNSIIR